MAKETAEEFNAQEMRLGRLTWKHITPIVKYYQLHHGLLVDGKIGKITRSTLASGEPSKLALAVVHALRLEYGKGESDGYNNSGPDIARYRRVSYVAGKRLYGAWCAWLASYCLSQATTEVLGVDALGAIGGAKRLVRTLGESDIGRFVDWRSEVLLPGDFIAWDRADPAPPWAGHVGIVVIKSNEHGRLRYADGNVGSYPSVVKERTGWTTDKRIELVARPL